MWLTWVGSIAALVFALILALYILKKDAGNEATRAISKHIQEGALAYLESSNPRNISLYERHGFEVMGEIQVGAGPLMTPMLRQPR